MHDTQLEYGDLRSREIAEQAYSDVWQRDWDFHVAQGADEGAYTTVPQFTTGSVAATNGSTTITFSTSASGAAAYRSGWTYPARISIGGSTNDYMVVSAATSTAVIDHAFAATTTSSATFELSFPVYSLPTDFARMCTPVRGSWFWDMHHIRYDQWLSWRARNSWAGPATSYA